eukprot:3748091-Amphidinium_carterae.1
MVIFVRHALEPLSSQVQHTLSPPAGPDPMLYRLKNVLELLLHRVRRHLPHNPPQHLTHSNGSVTPLGFGKCNQVGSHQPLTTRGGRMPSQQSLSDSRQLPYQLIPVSRSQGVLDMLGAQARRSR